LLLSAVVCLSFGVFSGQASAEPPPCADLEITNITVSPTNPVQGQPANISITVKNDGSCFANGFVTQFRTSLSSKTGPSASIAGLNAGESQTLNLPFVFNEAGNFEAVVEVDTGNAVPETNEENNLEIKSITVLPPGVNLVATGFRVEPVEPDPTDSVVQGRLARATINYTNTGTKPAGPFIVQWTPFALGKPLTKSVPGLAPGESGSVSMEYTFPFAATVKGTAFVDSTNAVAETDENDNTLTLSTEVQPPLPNLRVAGEGIDIHPAPAGSTSSLDVTVQNNGNENAGPFVVEWKPGPLLPAQAQQVNGLAEGAETTVTFDNVFNRAGTFNGTVTLDSTHVVSEVNENDNTAPTTFVIPAATIDLTITNTSIQEENECGRECDLRGNPLTHPALTLGPLSGTVTQEVPSTVFVTVKNIGNSPSGSFVTSWNPSALSIIVPGKQTLTQEVSSLGPDESRTLEFPFTYPKTGHFRSVAFADAFNTVKETNESNNQQVLNVTVLPAHIALFFSSPIEVSPGNPVVGEPATERFSVVNDGPIATGSFAVQLIPQSGGAKKTMFLPGLNVGEETTVEYPVTYFKKGTVTATAIIDPFNQVVKVFSPVEESQSITVIPKSASLDVTFDHFHIFALPSGYEEWKIFFLGFQPGAACTFKFEIEILGVSKSFEHTFKDVTCTETGETYEENFVHPGETLPANLTLGLHLEEQQPLAVSTVGLSLNKDIFGIITNIGLPGEAPLISPRSEYLELDGTHPTIQGKGCAQEDKTVVNGGHCYDAFYNVSVLSHVGNSAVLAPGATTKATNTIDRASAGFAALAQTAKAQAGAVHSGHATIRLTATTKP
jgi:subtilase family serine protease